MVIQMKWYSLFVSWNIQCLWPYTNCQHYCCTEKYVHFHCKINLKKKLNPCYRSAIKINTDASLIIVPHGRKTRKNGQYRNNFYLLLWKSRFRLKLVERGVSLTKKSTFYTDWPLNIISTYRRYINHPKCTQDRPDFHPPPAYNNFTVIARATCQVGTQLVSFV
jgi:hypothetical protein